MLTCMSRVLSPYQHFLLGNTFLPLPFALSSIQSRRSSHLHPSLSSFPSLLHSHNIPIKILHLQLGRQGNYENCGRLLFIPILSLLSFILPLYSSFFFWGGGKLYRNKTRLSVLFPYLSLFTLNFLFFVCIAHPEWSIQT